MAIGSPDPVGRQPRKEFIEIERFHEVVVRAHIQPVNAVVESLATRGLWLVAPLALLALVTTVWSRRQTPGESPTG